MDSAFGCESLVGFSDCKTQENHRVIHFKTSASDVISDVRTGSGSIGGVFDSAQMTSLPLRNNAPLPLHTNGESSRYSGQGNYDITEFPFYSVSGFGNPRAH